ncbi:spore germination protein KC [Halobacillus alkaliphilus]|uniref:Spore germination protein KC n=2 Tax=Halobacillus alkaliphilus TaxID=396056 RepID=A0A1I2PGW3_9BACI|nr:spore germination protein KC [Halobacillus alkaliphilus]
MVIKMIKKYAAVCLLVVGVSVLLTGCWNSKEINELAIVTTMGIDQAEEDGRFEVTIELANPPEVAGGSQSSGRASTATVYSATGDTLISAIRRIVQQTPREPFFPYTQSIVFGEELARSGIQDTFDLLERNQEFRTTPRVLIARGHTAKEVIKILSPLEKIPAKKLVKTSEISGKSLGETITVKVFEFVDQITSESAEPLVGGVSIIGDKEQGTGVSNIEDTEPNALIKSEGLAIFKDGHLKRWVEKEDARGMLWVVNKIESTIINLDCNQEASALSIKITNTHSSINAVIKNGQPTITIDVKEEGEVEEVLCNIDVTDQTTIQNFEKQLEDKTKQEIERAIKIAKEEKSDVFGFGEAINRKDPGLWKQIKKNYDEEFTALEVNIKVDAYITRSGMRTGSYNQE